MTVTALGTMTLGVALPGVALGINAGFDGIHLALPDIEARLSALLAFTPPSIDFSAQLSLCASIVADINAAISVGITPPSISAQIALVLALIGQLEITIGLINLKLDLLVSLQAMLLSGSVSAYAYDGTAASFGGEIGTATAGGIGGGAPGDHVNAIVLATSDSATWTSISTLFKVTP